MTEELRARAREALGDITDGRWVVYDDIDSYGWSVDAKSDVTANIIAEQIEIEEDAQFIAAAPELVRDLLAALETVDDALRKVEKFITARTEYVAALNNSRGDEVNHDYWRWQGGAEARRQLAESLGIPVPHNAGDKARILGSGNG